MTLLLLFGCSGDPPEGAPLTGHPRASCGDAAPLSEVPREAGQPLLEFDGEPPRNVLVVVFDTFRRDALSFYGSDRLTTPCLAARGAHLVRFDDAWSTAPWTAPSTASILTGLFVENHEVLHAVTGGADRAVDQPLRHPTLASVAQAQGFATALVSGNGWVGPVTGLDAGFEEVESPAGTDDPALNDAPYVGAKLRAALAALPEDRPFYAHVQLYDNHFAYTPQEEYADRWIDRSAYPWDATEFGEEGVRTAWSSMGPADQDRALTWLRGLYDAETLAEDAAVEDALVALDEAGRLDDTLVVILADHGESIGEGGMFGHGDLLRPELVRIPLLMYNPRLTGGTYAGVVRNIDVMPTALAAIGATVPDGLDGVAIVPGEGPSFAYGVAIPSSAELVEDPGYVYAGGAGVQVVRACASGRSLAYDLTVDPWAENPIEVDALPGAPELLEGLDATVARLQGDRAYAACVR